MAAYYDQHIHSDFSADSDAPMSAQAEAAWSRGLAGITFTDHYHPDYPEPAHRTGQPTHAYHHAMERLAEEYGGRLEVLKGLEMGVLLGDTLPMCEAAARDYPYDFILAAFHGTRTYTFDAIAGGGRVPVEEAFRRYYRHVLDCITVFKGYDALAHLNLIDRYGRYLPDDRLYEELIDEILRTVAADGKGIEINTSSWRYGMKDRTTPTPAILRRYRELGGEYVTVGSDAHSPDRVGDHLAEGYRMLRDLGWRHYVVYRAHEPQFVKL